MRPPNTSRGLPSRWRPWWFAAMAVAAVGFMMLTGRLNWRFGATVIVGTFILFGAGMSIRAFVKAGQYEEAQERYQRRRREVLNKNRKP